jgi:hypothetical protein
MAFMRVLTVGEVVSSIATLASWHGSNQLHAMGCEFRWTKRKRDGQKTTRAFPLPEE